MNIYLIEQDVLTGYDTFNAAVVIAENETKAKLIHPNEYEWNPEIHAWVEGTEIVDDPSVPPATWPAPAYIKVTLLGRAEADMKKGIVCADFRAS
jgi:hypothetical protein